MSTMDQCSPCGRTQVLLDPVFKQTRPSDAAQSSRTLPLASVCGEPQRADFALKLCLHWLPPFLRGSEGVWLGQWKGWPPVVPPFVPSSSYFLRAPYRRPRPLCVPRAYWPPHTPGTLTPSCMFVPGVQADHSGNIDCCVRSCDYVGRGSFRGIASLQFDRKEVVTPTPPLLCDRTGESFLFFSALFALSLSFLISARSFFFSSCSAHFSLSF